MKAKKMRGRKFLLIGLAVALVTLWASVGQANLLINGNFALGPLVSPTPGFTTVYSMPPGTIPGWTVFGPNALASVDYIAGYWQEPSDLGVLGANHSIDLDGLSKGGLAQAFATTSGDRYQVSFYLAGNPDGGPNPKEVLVTSVGSNTYTFDASATTRTSMGWTPESFDFTATSASTTLSFNSETIGAYGPVIGEVSVSQVPLPPTVLLLGSGLLGLVGLGRRWCRKTA